MDTKTIKFNGIYAKYRERVYYNAMKWVKCSETAEDITSQVFLKVYNNLDSYDSEVSSIKTWLYHITKSTIIDCYRKEKKHSDNISVSDYVDDYGRETVIVPDNHINTDSYYENRELMKKIKRTIYNLGFANRRVAILSFIKQMSYKDIAEICNLPMGTVKATIYRCRELLQKELKNEYSKT